MKNKKKPGSGGKAPDHKNGVDSEARDPGGRFRPGHGGRRPGSRNRATVICEQLIAGESEALTKKAIKLALGGNPTVLTALLRCLVPPVKEKAAPINFPLPPVTSATDAAGAMAKIIEGCSTGKLDGDQARAMVSILESFTKTYAASEFEARIAALETKRST